MQNVYGGVCYLEKLENIPQELGSEGYRVLEEMAVYVYSCWIEAETVYVPLPLHPLTYGADPDYFPDEDYFYYGLVHPENGSVEIEFWIGGFCDGFPKKVGCDGSIIFPKEKIQELWWRKCH